MPESPTIPWTTRNDLTSVDLGGFNQSSFAVKDRIKNEFYNFGELEFFILQSLRSTITLDGLKSAIQSKFGITIDAPEIVQYVNRLASDNLLVANQLGDGKRLFQQSRVLEKGERRQRVMGLLSIKFPGFYPGPLLNQLRPIGWLLFNPFSIAMMCFAAVCTICYGVFSIQTIIEKAPTVGELVMPNHLALMLVGFLIAKILHELGHGLACQNTGHECSEMGVLLLVFMPCLYCDVSDLWTEKNRWKRIFVSLAGVFVEIAIATTCFWIWYFSLDGQLSRFAFGMMLVTSINTLFVNGNPLMRYDGYYALSDWVGVPNLAAESRKYLTERIHAFFIRQEQFLDLNRRGLLLGGYAISAFIYRWLILAAICWAIWAFFESQQLASTGMMVVGLVLVVSVIPIVMSLKSFVATAFRRGLRFLNAFVLIGLLAFCVFILSNIEFTHRVVGQSDIELSNATHLFAPAAGELVPCVADGQTMKRGDLVARIINDDLTLEKISLEGYLLDVTLKLESLELASESTDVAGEIEFWKKRKTSYSKKIREIIRRQKALEIRAPVEGQVVVARRKPIDLDKAERDLSLIQGGLFDPANSGCHVARGDDLCYLGDTEMCKGYVNVNEKDIELVKVGQSVKVYVPHSKRFCEGQVVKVSLESEQEISNDSNSQGKFQLPSKYYVVEFEFEADSEIRIGSKHKTVILCQPTTPFGWLHRWWRNSMWF